MSLVCKILFLLLVLSLGQPSAVALSFPPLTKEQICCHQEPYVPKKPCDLPSESMCEKRANECQALKLETKHCEKVRTELVQIREGQAQIRRKWEEGNSKKR